MSKVREMFPTWDDFVQHATEENRCGYFLLPRDRWGEWWELDNEFYRKKHGKWIDRWIFTLYWVDKYWGKLSKKLPVDKLVIKS